MWLLTILALTGCDDAEQPDESCSVEDNEDETYTMTCPDGSTAVLTGSEKTLIRNIST